MTDDPEEIRRRQARAEQIRARIRGLISPGSGSDPASPANAPPEGAPQSPRDFIDRKMRDRDDTKKD